MKIFLAFLILFSLFFSSCTSEISSQENQVDIIVTRSADYDYSDWISLGTPPHGAVRVISAKDTTIWVESSNSKIFTATIEFGCGSNLLCWSWDTATTKPENNREPWALVRGEDCASLNPDPYRPITDPDGIMQECIYAPVPGIDMVGEFFFALMADGTIWFLDNTPPFVAK